jgi:hypothetical protein
VISGDLGLYGERLAVALGFLTLILFVGIGLTCRSFVSLTNRLKIGGLTKTKPYQGLFRFHSFFWYGLGVVLFLHIIAGVMHTSLPQSGDPDAFIHTVILIFAGSVLISVVLTFSNCRTFMGFLRVFRGEDLFTGAYKPFYRVHSYFWILLLLALIGHLTASYFHVGFWPTILE